MDTHYIGAYQIIGELGTGSFGKVYKAYQPFLDREVAIKTLHGDFFDHERSASEQLFIREGRTIALLRHPNIVNVYEFGVAQDSLTNERTAFMVMEYLPGGSLERRIRKGPLDYEIAVRLIEQIAQGLTYAHERSVIHRDLKPANILFTETGQAVIVDFGLAKLAEENYYDTPEPEAEIAGSVPAHSILSTRGSTIIGTPRYMAPEQLVSLSVSAATDQYALALIAFEMLTKSVPFESDDLSVLMVQRAQEAPPSILAHAPAVPSAVNEVLKRALSRDPAERYPDANSFAQAFGDALLPNRQRERVIQVIDPLQAAQLRTARQYVTGFLAMLGLFVLVVMLFCAAEFIRGFASGSQPEFLWDGLIVSTLRQPDGNRVVNGVMPGSVAEAAGYRTGDEFQDDLILDKSDATASFLVNSSPRYTLNVDWKPKPGDQIQRRVQRGETTLILTYTLQRSRYPLAILAATLFSAFAGVACGFMLLRWWGAEPGIQVFVPLTFLFGIFIVSRSVANLILYFDTLAFHLLLAVALHMIIVFPEEMDWVKRHPRRIWWVYAPVLVGLYYLLTRSPIIVPIIHIPLQAIDYAAFSVIIIVLLVYKWLRKDLKAYRGMRWLLLGLGLGMVLSLYYVVVFYLLPMNILNSILGGAALQMVVNDILLVLLQSFVPFLGAVGVHLVQKQLGSTFSGLAIISQRNKT